jgi:hypothetical protein
MPLLPPSASQSERPPKTVSRDNVIPGNGSPTARAIESDLLRPASGLVNIRAIRVADESSRAAAPRPLMAPTCACRLTPRRATPQKKVTAARPCCSRGRDGCAVAVALVRRMAAGGRKGSSGLTSAGSRNQSRGGAAADCRSMPIAGMSVSVGAVRNGQPDRDCPAGDQWRVLRGFATG